MIIQPDPNCRYCRDTPGEDVPGSICICVLRQRRPVDKSADRLGTNHSPSDTPSQLPR